ncbi:MAG: KGK family protein [Microcoleaceae cyanobacterium]
MNDSFKILCPDDVIYTGASALMFQCTFKVSEFLAMMQSKLEEEHLFAEGMNCHVLQPNQPWRQGQVKISLQFVSDASVDGSTPIPDSSFPQPINGNCGNTDSETVPPPLQRKTHCVGMWS